VIQLVDGPVLGPIECARRGDTKELADRIRGGSASTEERAAAGDILEGKFEFANRRDKVSKYEALKFKAIAAYMFYLEDQGGRTKLQGMPQ
jgi:hypothetical protein